MFDVTRFLNNSIGKNHSLLTNIYNVYIILLNSILEKIATQKNATILQNSIKLPLPTRFNPCGGNPLRGSRSSPFKVGFKRMGVSKEGRENRNPFPLLCVFWFRFLHKQKMNAPRSG
jgi:hypothetical protein